MTFQLEFSNIYVYICVCFTKHIYYMYNNPVITSQYIYGFEVYMTHVHFICIHLKNVLS